MNKSKIDSILGSFVIVAMSACSCHVSVFCQGRLSDLRSERTVDRVIYARDVHVLLSFKNISSTKKERKKEREKERNSVIQF